MDCSDIVELHISSNVDRGALPRRFSKSITIPTLKGKLEMITGGSAATMKLSLYDCQDQFVCSLDSETLELGSFPVQSGMRLHVDDKSISKFELSATNTTEKFDLTEDEYDTKRDTLRSYLRQTNQGKYNAAEMQRLADVKQAREQQLATHLATLSVDKRCQIARAGHPEERGCVKFVGETDFGPGVWIGVQLDEPMGKNDGSVKDRRYFQCEPKYGVFVRPNIVQCGDFPELSIMDEDEM